jgi:ribonuclease P protein component
MIPPKESDIGIHAEQFETPPAVSVCLEVGLDAIRLETMKNRPDYLRTAQGRRQGTGSFLLQGRARGDADPLVRIGFTASKKIGNAVARNRAKRRLRALAREVLPKLARAGWDYVLVAKPEATISRDYKDMLADFDTALRSVHKGQP